MFRERVDGGSSGVAEAEELCRLVKGLSGRIVEGLAEYPVTGEALEEHQGRVSTGDDEGDKGELRRILLLASFLQEGGVGMGLYVVYACKRKPAHVRERLGERQAYKERAHEPGPLRHGYSADVVKGLPGNG